MYLVYGIAGAVVFVIVVTLSGVMLSYKSKRPATNNTTNTAAAQPKLFDWRWLALPVALILGLIFSPGLVSSVTGSLPTTWWLWGLTLAGLVAGIYFTSKKNDVGPTILKYSLVSLGGLMLATWLGLGNVVKVGQNIGDTLAGNSPVRTVTRTAPATVVPAIPAGALTSITVPSCYTSWSAEIPLHGSKWQMTPAWSAKTTMMSFLIDGEWSQATSIALSGGSHIRYCTVKDTLTGKTMPLNWKWLGN